jgi:hypothetical protein
MTTLFLLSQVTPGHGMPPSFHLDVPPVDVDKVMVLIIYIPLTGW